MYNFKLFEVYSYRVIIIDIKRLLRGLNDFVNYMVK